MDLGRAIKNIRMGLGLTQIQLSNSVGISRSYLSSIENGREVGYSVMHRLCDEMCISVFELLFEAMEEKDVVRRDLYSSLHPALLSIYKTLMGD